MSSMAAVPVVDPRPVLDLIKKKGGECSFDDGVTSLEARGLSKSDARDAIWRLLSQGIIEFTTDRHLRLPHPALEKAAG